MNLADFGYNRLGIKESILKDELLGNFYDGVQPELFVSGEMGANLKMVDGDLRSREFETGVTGWQITAEGDVEFESGYFRGDISGASGSFSGAIEIGIGNDIIKADGSSGLWVGHADFASAPFKVALDGSATVNNLYIAGGVGVANLTDSGALALLDLVGTGQIENLAITNAKIGESLTVGNTDAKCTDPNADQTSINTSADTAKVQGSTIIIGGFIGTDFLTATNIEVGTLTGIDIIAKGGGSGIDVKLNSATGRVEFIEGTDTIGFIAGVAGTQDVRIDADNNLIITADGVRFDYNIDNTGEDLHFISNGSTKWIMDTSGDLIPNNNNEVDLGSSTKAILKGWFEDIDVDDLVVNTGCSGCAYQEMNLLQPQEKTDFLLDRKKPKEERIKDKKAGKKYNPTGFEEGDLLAWKNGKLIKAKSDTCKCVVAVSSLHGMPVVLGAERVKVTGQVEEGDYLVSTETEGYARAWTGEKEAPTGTVIAKAMEGNKSGKGLIMAMINNF